MLWEVEVRPAANEVDREAARVVNEAQALGASTVKTARSARSFLLQAASLSEADVVRAARVLLVDPVAEEGRWSRVDGLRPENGRNSSSASQPSTLNPQLLNVLYKPGVTDNVGMSTQKALVDLGFNVEAVATGRKYWFNEGASSADLDRVMKRVQTDDAGKIFRCVYEIHPNRAQSVFLKPFVVAAHFHRHPATSAMPARPAWVRAHATAPAGSASAAW